jgi:hypothetical protein
MYDSIIDLSVRIEKYSKNYTIRIFYYISNIIMFRHVINMNGGNSLLLLKRIRERPILINSIFRRIFKPFKVFISTVNRVGLRNLQVNKLLSNDCSLY